MEHRLKFKRIGVVYLGGLTRRFRSSADLGEWLGSVYEWRMIGRLQPYVASGQWHKVVRSIVDDWKKCDGFVVILPQEDAFYLASCIAMMLGNVGKPIAYVRPESKIEELQPENDMGFRAQMINALQIVTQDISGHIGTRSHIAFPLAEMNVKEPRTLYGYFDFGYRLAPNAIRRTAFVPTAPRLKVLAHIREVESVDKVPEADAYVLSTQKMPDSVARPTLVIQKNAHAVMIDGVVSKMPPQASEMARAQFTWAVQKALEAGDFGDLVPDMLNARIDIERV